MWNDSLSSPTSLSRGAVQRGRLSGPRVGITSSSTGIVDKLKTERSGDLAPVSTQFGWHSRSSSLAGMEARGGRKRFV